MARVGTTRGVASLPVLRLVVDSPSLASGWVAKGHGLITFRLTEELRMAKLRHIALSVPDPEKTADFYCDAFDMQRVGTTDSPLATGVYVSRHALTG